MNEHLGLGVLLVLFAGTLNGSFALPMKRMTAWKWENIWLVYSIAGMVAAPWIFALSTVPQLAQVYHQASWHVVILVLLFGFGSGAGSVLFGLGIERLGLALGFAVVLGIMASLGSLLPMAILHPSQLFGRQGQILIAGTCLVIVGIVAYAAAGRLRERELNASLPHADRSQFAIGLAICVASGVLSALLNFAFLFGAELQTRAVSLGATASNSANPIWALALTAAFLANGGYTIYLLRKNHSWSAFKAPASPWLYCIGGIVMGAFWFGSVAFYGMGASALGSLGGIVGWPAFMAMIIFTANFWGAVTGEWVKASRRAVTYCWTGMTILLLAIYVISLASKA